jgi:elongation factor G
VTAIRERLGALPIPVQIPDGAAESFHGIVDLIADRYLTFDSASLGREMTESPIPEHLVERAKDRKRRMFEQLADLHEPLAETFLADEAPTPAQLIDALRATTLSRAAVPVLCGAALRNVGVQPLLDAVCRYLPSPGDVPAIEGTDPRDGTAVVREPTPGAPFSALVFKVTASPAADLFYARVYSGTLEAGGRALNPRTRERERLRRILRMHADRGEPVERIDAGDIVAIAGLHGSMTGDTLCDEAAPVMLEAIRFPETVVSVAVEPKTSQDRDRLAEILARVQREDPTFRCGVDAETGQTILSGMGELHLEVVLQRMQRDFGVELSYGKPRVSYRETIAAHGVGRAEYRRQVAGENLFARVELALDPLASRRGIEVKDGMRPGAVPQAYLPAILDSIRNAAEGGGLFGYPVTGIAATLVSAVFDDVGQPEIALNSATSLAFREALRAATAVVLEPYGRLEVRIPEDYLGNVMKTLSQRRAIVEETGFSKSAILVRGVVPIGEMFGYLTVLRSQTQGRGSFSLEPLDYRPVPDNLVALHHERLYS